MGTVRNAYDQTLLPTNELISEKPKCKLRIEGHKTSYPICAVFVESRILTLPSSLESISAESFTGVSATVVKVPAGCKSIGNQAFKDSSVSRILIPGECKLGEDVFDGCGFVVLVSTEGSYAQQYCVEHDNCYFEKAE